MRIISGRFKGVKLADIGAGDIQAHLRPTSDRVRESIFNLLANGGYEPPLEGADVLDLFAGTGALGLEALSRGANSATFVENSPTSLKVLKKNISLTNTHAQTRIAHETLPALNSLTGPKFDFVFMDPPYGKKLGAAALNACIDCDLLADDALVIWEEGAQQLAPFGFRAYDSRRYGDTWVHIMGRAT